jgi:hypothetical protein
MKKVAIFAEGQTEQIFVTELLRHIFGHAKIGIEALQFSGKTGARRIRTIWSVVTMPSAEYLFRIYDCHGGGENSTVKSDIKEQFLRLKDEAFSYIIGIRDVYPMPDIVKLKKMMNVGLPDFPILPINIFLAVREVEAWFIAEENHYFAISPSLTLHIVNCIAGIDIQKDSTEIIKHPAAVLDKIYKAGGRQSGYSKNEYVVKDIVSKLDYDNFYIAVRKRNDSLNELLTCLDGFIP